MLVGWLVGWSSFGIALMATNAQWDNASWQKQYRQEVKCRARTQVNFKASLSLVPPLTSGYIFGLT
jgi:hypothetical protein